jgi:coproporphyrinogen III oxidase-like Fe-S oxidoreductase
VPAPDPDLQADMFEAACASLAGAGYVHYEVSNWAKPGFECLHNLGYWERRPYVGLGAGAHSFRDNERWWNLRPPDQYMAAVQAGELPIGGSERLRPADERLESMFLQLRTFRGVPSDAVDRDRATLLLEAGLLAGNNGSFVPTERGMLVLNELVLALADQ